MIDELTGLPTTRTGAVSRREGALGPGAELGVRCAHLTRVGCPHEGCTCGYWDIWHDLGTDEYAFVHHAVDRWEMGRDASTFTGHLGATYTRKFATFHVRRTREWRGTPEGCLAYLASHEVHPANAPTPGKARRR